MTEIGAVDRVIQISNNALKDLVYYLRQRGFKQPIMLKLVRCLTTDKLQQFIDAKNMILNVACLFFELPLSERDSWFHFFLYLVKL